mmetsp:Transcript_46269/g.119229  ORF Transcript_46269/g.119229 Transcript_46269/m.119229 type:complete len:124 (+) Transcript_46269:881-1252(+)
MRTWSTEPQGALHMHAQGRETRTREKTWKRKDGGECEIQAEKMSSSRKESEEGEAGREKREKSETETGRKKRNWKRGATAQLDTSLKVKRRRTKKDKISERNNTNTTPTEWQRVSSFLLFSPP